MCGIFGVVGNRISEQQALKCLNTLTHRGPDGYGLWQKEDVVLGHRRLSILDLSDAGKQPMTFQNERYILTFNGEIYNFLEIREELIGKGYTFQSESDSEVLLAAFAEWGEECVNRFNGMWAFAIWDQTKKQLFMCRDRFGVKPLFWCELPDGGVAFASEMKAIMPLLDAPKPNHSLFNYYYHIDMHYEALEECLIEGIKRFPAGHYAWIDPYSGQKQRYQRYWNTLDHIIEVPDDYDEQVEMFRELFLDACKLRMRSDVTLGTALSGGLDSSATICAMAYLSGNAKDVRMNKDWQHAYVATFPGTDLNETRYAKMVTDYLGISNTYYDANLKIEEDCILEQMYLFEELWQNIQLPITGIYRQEKRDGTTVSIDGHAADELFAGYDFDIKKAIPDTKFNKAKSKELIEFCLKQDESRCLTEQELRKAFRAEYYSMKGKYYAKKFLGRSQVRSRDAGHDKWSDLGNLNQTLYVSTHETVLPTMLRNYDRNSMSQSVEIRMPFLDYRIVQFAFSIPWNSKFRNGFNKAIIRDAIAPFTPKEIAYRKTKIGFNAPIHTWLDEATKEYFGEIIHSSAFTNSSVIENPSAEREAIRGLLEKTELSFPEAMEIWNRIQPYYWEKAFLKGIH